MTTHLDDFDQSIQPIIRRAWEAWKQGEQLDSVTMTTDEYERFWKGLGYREAPLQGACLYGVPITITDG